MTDKEKYKEINYYGILMLPPYTEGLYSLLDFDKMGKPFDTLSWMVDEKMFLVTVDKGIPHRIVVKGDYIFNLDSRGTVKVRISESSAIKADTNNEKEK